MSIQESRIEVASRWGRPALYPVWRHADPSKKLAVLLPGHAYPLEAPLMWYAAKAALAAGYDVLGIEYGFQANRSPMKREDFPYVVQEARDALVTFLKDTAYRQFVWIAKSMGTAVTQELSQVRDSSENSYIFLTPVRQTIPFITSAERMMVVVGSQDPLFDAFDIEQISGLATVDLHVVPDAHHLLEIADDLDQTIVILRQVTQLCAEFCKTNVSPNDGGY